MTARSFDGRFLIHAIANAYWEPLAFELPRAAGRHRGWRRLIDTDLDSPHDICPGPDAPLVSDDRYPVQPRSVVVLFATAALESEALGHPERHRIGNSSKESV